MALTGFMILLALIFILGIRCVSHCLKTTVPASRLEEIKEERVIEWLMSPLPHSNVKYKQDRDFQSHGAYLKAIGSYLTSDPLKGVSPEKFSKLMDEAFKESYCSHQDVETFICGADEVYFCTECWNKVYRMNYEDFPAFSISPYYTERDWNRSEYARA